MSSVRFVVELTLFGLAQALICTFPAYIEPASFAFKVWLVIVTSITACWFFFGFAVVTILPEPNCQPV